MVIHFFACFATFRFQKAFNKSNGRYENLFLEMFLMLFSSNKPCDLPIPRWVAALQFLARLYECTEKAIALFPALAAPLAKSPLAKSYSFYVNNFFM